MTLDLALVTTLDADNPVEGDLRVERAAFALVEGADAIAQEIQVRLRWWRGEWFLDQRQGVPYLEELLGKGVSADVVRAVLRSEIDAVPGVARVSRLDVALDRATRQTTVDIEVDTDGGGTVSVSTGVGS